MAHQTLGFRIAQHAGEDPTLIAYLVSLASEGITLRGMSDILHIAGPNAKVDTAVRNTVLTYHPTRDFARCWKGEAVFGITTIHDTTDASALPSVGKRVNSGLLGKRAPGQRLWLWDANEAYYLHWMTLGLKAAEQREALRPTAVNLVFNDYDRSLRLMPPAALMACILYPFGFGAATIETRRSGQRAVVTEAAAVLEFHARHNRYPRDLTELEGAVPADPWSGKPLGYRLEDKGFVVYSAGETKGFTASPRQSTKNESFFRYP